MLVLPQQTRISQPQTITEINWNNPVTKQLKFATNHANPILDLVSKTLGTVGGTIKKTNTQYTHTEANDTSSFINWGIKPLTDDASGITIALFAKGASEGTISRAFVIGSESSGSGNNAAQIVFNASNNHTPNGGVLDVCEYQSGFISSTHTISGAVDGKFNIWVCRREGATSGWTIFKNGLTVSSANNGSGGAFTFTSGVRLHGAPVSTSQGFKYPILMSAIFSRRLADAEIASLSANPWQIFQPDRRAIFLPASSVSLTYLRPTSDIITNAWTPSTGTTLYSTLDEVTADDADYIQASTATSCEIKLAAGSTPTSRDNHTIKYRLLPGTGTVQAVLKCGSTTIKSWTHTLTGSAQDISNVLTNAEASAITDYTDLRVTFTSS